jgi:hypothetical protein
MGGGIVSPFTAWSAFNEQNSGSVAPATITFKSDGTVTNSPVDPTGSSNWYSPTTAGVGAGFYARFTPTTGVATVNNAASWTSLSANLSLTKSASTGDGSCTFTVEIATDIGGSNIVFTSTGNDCSYSHI